LRFVAAAGFPGAPVSGVPAAAFGSFATCDSVSYSTEFWNFARLGRSMLRPYKAKN
jgi:hypothetical protein